MAVSTGCTLAWIRRGWWYIVNIARYNGTMIHDARQGLDRSDAELKKTGSAGED